MAHELRNLPHIASMAFNEPLMLEPAYARVFFCALAGQLGITRLTDTVSGITLDAGQIAEPLALFGEDDDMDTRPSRTYQVANGIAVLPVSGTLVSKTRALQPYSGMTGYNGIIARLQQAISDPGVDGILLDMDTPGGMVSGAFDCADIIARMRDIKPIWALANDMNCSAGQLIASSASRRLVTQTARTGSIGVMMAHSNYGAALKTNGVEVTLIYSGDHKVDGNPYEKLPEDVRADFQTRIDATRQMFAEKVSAYTGMSVQDVLDTEAAVFSGQESVDNGLADELVNNTDALGVMREALDRRKKTTIGGTMPSPSASAATNNPADQASTQTTTSAEQLTDADTTTAAIAAPADVSAQVSAAVAAENSRIMGILNCDEAKGRESQARALAETPGMTVESAQRILAAAPQSAQARTDTALDRLMETAPGALAAGSASADAADDLLNTPV
ncbi:S49 family peptidase [Enterobacter hormaechei]|uniref:S49 family peptidase n=1 Tax=Enterobacter cloacae complex TaxID=354276 RepID=UPI0006D9B793|nr:MULTISPECIES: S49 family peptidase [Enterobacter cloacae complex]ELJ6237662.1 S49 family peptidase [Enterobacter hormaechei]ELZ5042157.1 S49 family peptidase [Enterobacter hormaechei]KPU04481.1 capsid assembly protein [Enterobacter cloacae subsp. cloacae]KVI49596.1 capsid assembly protein [Enterobacter cloacae subsp. cloacae]MBT1745127.1 S49 family peptidase [Enterobacter hormaechei subsp. xiangfangensis]